MPILKTPFVFRPRERRLALIAAVMVSCWLLVSWVIQPLWDHAATLHQQVETQSEKLDALSQLLSHASAIEQEHQAVVASLTKEDGAQAQGTLLNELETLTRGSGLQMNLKPRTSRQEERRTDFEVEVDLEGPQEQLLGFVDSLLRMPRLILIERLRISSIPARENVLRANLVIQQLALPKL